MVIAILKRYSRLQDAHPERSCGLGRQADRTQCLFRIKENRDRAVFGEIMLALQVDVVPGVGVAVDDFA